MSLHAIAGGMVMAIIMILLKYCYYDLVLQVLDANGLLIKENYLLCNSLAGIIGTGLD